MQRKQFLRYVGAAVATPLIAACGGGGTTGTTGTEALSTAEAAAAPVVTSTSTLSAEEVAGLRFMREEEKLAHDVYVAMYARWGQQVFANIAESETTHTTAILGLLTKYGVEDPVAGHGPGEFEDPALQALYDTLVAAGAVSLVEGLKVGALIEETDIRDIETRRAVTDEDDILGVYGSLLCGSRNHLRAFNSALLDQGVSYTAQVITQDEWDAIASSARETCGG